MKNKPDISRQWIRVEWPAGFRRGLIICFICIITSFLLIGCEKETDTDPDPAYQPIVKKQFGSTIANVQEVSFRANNFTIVGDLRMPVEGEVHPLIIMVHGSGGATRNGAVPFEPLIEIFLRNGYAVLSWDKPGSGKSTGEFRNGYTITDRAKIVVSAIEVMLDNPSIGNTTIGLWGISQGGWVLPKALDMTNHITFMIIVSGGGEDGIEQYAYQMGQVAACAGENQVNIEKVEKYWSQMAKASDFTQYKEAADILIAIPSIVAHTGFEVSEENEWNPWPREIDAFFDPMDVIRNTTIPMLVFFGELDKNVDPVQGAQAYEAALEQAGNTDYMIKVIEGVGHILSPATTGCLSEPVSSQYIPEYLDTMEDWLRNLNP
jgi:pimeloyl-ACP methyl ester carboxylesterase